MESFLTKVKPLLGTALCVFYFLFVVLLAMGVSSQNWDTSGSSEYDLYEGEKEVDIVVVAIYSTLSMVYLMPWFRYFRRIRKEYNHDYWPFGLDINVVAKTILTVIYVLLTLSLLYNLVRLPIAQATVQINTDGFACRDFDSIFFEWLATIFIGTPIYALLSFAGIRY